METVVEGGSEELPWEWLGKAKVAEFGAGRVNEERWEVLVRGMFVFCRSVWRLKEGGGPGR